MRQIFILKHMLLSLHQAVVIYSNSVKSSIINLSAPSVHVLSAHGELEQVALYVKSITTSAITTSAITTLIINSPNPILLYIVTIELCDKNGVSLDREDCNKYKDTLSKTFSYHKLLTTDDFILEQGPYHHHNLFQTLAPFNTNFNSFWKLNYCCCHNTTCSYLAS